MSGVITPPSSQQIAYDIGNTIVSTAARALTITNTIIEATTAMSITRTSSTGKASALTLSTGAGLNGTCLQVNQLASSGGYAGIEVDSQNTNGPALLMYDSGGTFRRVTMELGDGVNFVGVGTASRGAIRYNNTTKTLQASLNAGAWADFAAAGGAPGWTYASPTITLTTSTDQVGIGAIPGGGTKFRVTGDTTSKEITLTCGDGTGAGINGGAFSAASGAAGTTGTGGTWSGTGGTGGTVSGNGGQASLTAGSASLLGAGGLLSLGAGSAAGLDQNGGTTFVSSGPSTGAGTSTILLRTAPVAASGVGVNALTTTMTLTNAATTVNTGTLSVPGSGGATSEIFGASATNGTGTNVTILGAGSTNTTGNSNTITGAGSSCGAGSSNNVVNGQGASTGTASNNVVEGQGASVIGTSNLCVVVGQGSTQQTGVASSTIVGAQSVGGNTGFTVEFGYGNSSSGKGNNIILGRGMSSTAASGTLTVGGDAQAAGNMATAAAQAVFGTDAFPYNDFYLGRGKASTTAGGTSIHATDGSGAGNSGSALRLAGGLAGDAATAGGVVSIRVALAGTGTTLADVLTVDPVGGGTVTVTSSADFAFQVSTTSASGGGRVGYYECASTLTTGVKQQLVVSDSTALAAAVGGGLALYGSVRAGPQVIAPLVSIYASKVNATDNDRNAWCVVACNNNVGGSVNNGVATFAVKDLRASMNSGVVLGWTASATDPTAAADTGISRLAAGSFAFGTGAASSVAGTINYTTCVQTGLTTKYNNVTTAGWGVPAIYANGRSTAQTAAVASVATYTVGAADGSFEVSANVLVTASATNNFTVTVAYTDESNSAQTLTLTFSSTGGTLLTAITNVLGTGAYEGLVQRIRCKASTSITVATVGTFTSVTYNVEAGIKQVS